MNGTFIADMAYEDPEHSGRYHKVGALLYFRTHELKIKLSEIPQETVTVIGKFRKTEKVPEAPYIEGDLFHGGLKVGHIHSEQNGVGNTLYWCKLFIPFKLWDEKEIWLKARLEDE